MQYMWTISKHFTRTGKKSPFWVVSDGVESFKVVSKKVAERLLKHILEIFDHGTKKAGSIPTETTTELESSSGDGGQKISSMDQQEHAQKNIFDCYRTDADDDFDGFAGTVLRSGVSTIFEDCRDKILSEFGEKETISADAQECPEKDCISPENARETVLPNSEVPQRNIFEDHRRTFEVCKRTVTESVGRVTESVGRVTETIEQGAKRNIEYARELIDYNKTLIGITNDVRDVIIGIGRELDEFITEPPANNNQSIGFISDDRTIECTEYVVL